MKKKKLTYRAYSTNLYPNGKSKDTIKIELINHLNNDRKRTLSIEGEQAEQLYLGVVEAYGWRQIANVAENTAKSKKPNGKKDERKQLLRLKDSIDKVEECLFDLTASDEKQLDNFLYLASKLHLEEARKEDCQETRYNKLIAQRSTVLEPDIFNQMHNKVQGRGAMALIIFQFKLGVEYAIRRLNASANNNKLRKHMTEINCLSCYFSTAFPQRRISPRKNSLFYKYVEFYLKEYYNYQEGRYPNVQISTVINNYLTDTQLIDDNPSDPLGVTKRLLNTYKI